ncbi:MAG: hypothetical protein P4M15_02560 [Alphaproteobacteria bacterium]|nr:hypothetical protein [Alphaproteobacteria bacterium]
MASGIDPSGKPVRSIYTEDVCILSSRLRQLIRAKPEGKEFPEESLAECCERINLQKMREQDGAFYRFGEVSRDNTAMMRQLNDNGAIIGGADSAVLEFKGLPNNLMDKLPMDVKVIRLRKDGVFDNDNFITRWHEAHHDVRFIATKGRATAIGRPRADTRPWRSIILPQPAILECVVASSLLAIKREAEERKWGNGDASSTCAALGAPMPDVHMHVNNREMLDALTACGARPRFFGNKSMVPGVNILRQ